MTIYLKVPVPHSDGRALASPVASAALPCAPMLAPQRSPAGGVPGGTGFEWYRLLFVFF